MITIPSNACLRSTVLVDKCGGNGTGVSSPYSNPGDVSSSGFKLSQSEKFPWIFFKPGINFDDYLIGKFY